MRARLIVTMVWTLMLTLYSSVTVAGELKTNFGDPAALTKWEITGDAKVDETVKHEGQASLKIGPGSKALWKLRDNDGSGKVSLWIKEDGTIASNPKKRRVGPRWGVLQSDGRVLVFGEIYAPYLAGDKTYTISDSDQKTWFNVQYVGEKRDQNWNNWVFSFDPKNGMTIHRNKKLIKRFDWNKTRMKAFSGVVVFGDETKGKPHIVWVSDVTATLGGEMSSMPTPPPPAPPCTPDKDPVPAEKVLLVEELRTVHPRLLFTREDIPKMKAFLTTADGKKSMAKLAKYVGGSTAPAEPVKFLKDATDGQRQGLWRSPTVGMHYVLTGDSKSKEKALGFMKLFLKLENWEIGKEQDSGMSSANIAIGAALLYDWLYNDLEPDFRAKYRDKLLLMARRQYHRGHLNKQKSVGYWQGDPQNNHRWHRNAGMALCALAAAEDDKDDDEWILSKLKEDLDYVNKWLPADGTTHEGPSYMIFGLAHLMLGMQAADHCLGTKYLDNEFYKTVPEFIISAMAPGFKGLLPYGDCSAGTGGIGSYANVLYMCAAHHDKKDLISGVRQIEKGGKDAFWLGWFDMIWLRPASSKVGDYTKMPTSSFWPDVGVLYIRDNWSPDAVASMFKCGPLGGYTLNKFRNENKFKYINVAHDDFDANSFTIFNDGAMTARTDGYAKHKQASHHNTILVNQIGQLVPGRMKEDTVWNQPGNGDMTKMAVVTTLKEEGDIVIIEGEAAESYPAVTKGKSRPKLEQYRRSYIWVKGKYILVLDAIRSAAAADITWMMQSSQLDEVDAAGGTYQLKNGKAVCNFQVLSDTKTTGRIVTGTADHRGKNLGRKQLQLTANGSRLRFASVYNPWQLKTLSVTLTPKDAKSATITVTGPNFKDTWSWQTPTGLFIPSLINGEVGGKEISVTEEDVAPK